MTNMFIQSIEFSQQFNAPEAIAAANNKVDEAG
ncbi:hypothetical protein L917_16539 [Phytophthora nicotianae]|uniref:Uncharacterized protein n=3 Tax=Phytophthora nicotianae TaxID=4792 RepID=W2QZY5_PHYN3|nr:hypothetical protein PPTG_21499 [Phytophthora nicotianae INRA-310]ETL83518.1 hypothetical protein L917_16539 [Phytophthora nicotianae]ETN18029.1 hypothetical protein PPTG_21499 [Phytophthora nicotianae INRA-310]ETO65364.1 hypothetical protein F444_17311 [Phytophthora nicotianae P1976]